MTNSTGYTLKDGVAQNKQYPATFEIPPAIQREHLRPGDFAKLWFEDAATGFVERMWVMIKSVSADGNYVGTLNNHPVDMPCLKFDDIVAFEPKHVIGAMQPE